MSLFIHTYQTFVAVCAFFHLQKWKYTGKCRFFVCELKESKEFTQFEFWVLPPSFFIQLRDAWYVGKKWRRYFGVQQTKMYGTSITPPPCFLNTLKRCKVCGMSRHTFFCPIYKPRPVPLNFIQLLKSSQLLTTRSFGLRSLDYSAPKSATVFVLQFSATVACFKKTKVRRPCFKKCV
jgi:hypothetical protein